MEKLIKIILSILFFLCLLKMPYGYYEIVRFAALVGFTILAYKAYEKDNTTAMMVYTGLALLFQPFLKLALGRELWNIIDVIVGIGLLGTLIFNSKLK